jgi:AcrR family transcriptional regulator
VPNATGGDSDPKQDRARQTRHDVLQAAARTFARVGYPAARLDDICQEADVTKGALYFHFRSKAELARAVVTAHFARWMQTREDVEKLALDPLTHVVALSFAVASSYRDDVMHRAGVRLVKEYKLIEIEVPRPFVGWIGELAAHLARAKGEGLVRENLDCDAAANSIVASFFGTQEIADQLPDGEDRICRWHQWWSLVLPTLTADPEQAAGILSRFDTKGCMQY